MKGNAIIKGTVLGYGDYGVLTCYLMLEQDSINQSFGGWTLDNRPAKDSSGHYSGNRQPSVLAGFWIKRILETVGVEKWEDLKGKYVRVEGDIFGAIEGIGHIVEDRWFFPERETEELARKQKEGE